VQVTVPELPPRRRAGELFLNARRLWPLAYKCENRHPARTIPTTTNHAVWGVRGGGSAPQARQRKRPGSGLDEMSG
jgi:hypothetical protein